MFRYRKPLFSGVMALVGTGLLIAAAFARPGLSVPSRDSSEQVKNGGTLRISDPYDVDAIDPARAFLPESWQMEQATCALLVRSADRLSRHGSLRIVPEVAAGWPRSSRDGKKYTFTIRKGFRFNTGEHMTARNFAYAINRDLNPTMESPAATYLQDVVGAGRVTSGAAATASGVLAKGNRLTIRLLRPVPDFTARMTMPFFCAIPLGLPITREGASAPLPSAGPYYVARWEPGRALELVRNPLYRGGRPHHASRFVYTIGESWERTLERMTRGETDYVYATPARTPEEVVVKLARIYGINRSQFFVKPSGGVFFLALNSSRPLFRNNPKLRQAVNFAIDRTALTAERGPYSGTLTDQYLPPSMPGYRDAHIYPLRRPDLSRARALAKGRTRAGKAVLYTAARPLGLSYARIIQDNLRRIGIEAEIKAFPPEVLFAKELLRGEPFDIAWAAYAPDYLDPYSMLNLQFHGGAIGSFNYSHFDSPRYNRLLDHAARLSGAARARAYGTVDIDLARDAAPRVAVSIFNQRLFVGARVGCRILDPLTGLNLAAACLR